MNTVLTIGAFQHLHAGHRLLLRTCRRIAGPAGRIIVGVNSDRFVRAYKGEPAQTYAERRRAVHAAGYFGVMNDGPGRELIEHVRPDFLVIGSDWTPETYLAQIDCTRAQLEALRVTLLYLDRDPAGPASSREDLSLSETFIPGSVEASPLGPDFPIADPHLRGVWWRTEADMQRAHAANSRLRSVWR